MFSCSRYKYYAISPLLHTDFQKQVIGCVYNIDLSSRTKHIWTCSPYSHSENMYTLLFLRHGSQYYKHNHLVVEIVHLEINTHKRKWSSLVYVQLDGMSFVQSCWFTRRLQLHCLVRDVTRTCRTWPQLMNLNSRQTINKPPDRTIPPADDSTRQEIIIMC